MGEWFCWSRDLIGVGQGTSFSSSGVEKVRSKETMFMTSEQCQRLIHTDLHGARPLKLDMRLFNDTDSEKSDYAQCARSFMYDTLMTVDLYLHTTTISETTMAGTMTVLTSPMRCCRTTTLLLQRVLSRFPPSLGRIPSLVKL